MLNSKIRKIMYMILVNIRFTKDFVQWDNFAISQCVMYVGLPMCMYCIQCPYQWIHKAVITANGHLWHHCFIPEREKKRGRHTQRIGYPQLINYVEHPMMQTPDHLIYIGMHTFWPQIMAELFRGVTTIEATKAASSVKIFSWASWVLAVAKHLKCANSLVSHLELLQTSKTGLQFAWFCVEHWNTLIEQSVIQK